MDMQLAGEELIVRFRETIDKGVSGILRPWQIRREDRARLQDHLRRASVIRSHGVDVF